MPKPKIMAKNPEKKDSVRRAQNKYQLANFKVVGCKLPKEVAERFDAKAKADGKTANAVLTEFVMKYLEGEV